MPHYALPRGQGRWALEGRPSTSPLLPGSDLQWALALVADHRHRLVVVAVGADLTVRLVEGAPPPRDLSGTLVSNPITSTPRTLIGQ